VEVLDEDVPVGGVAGQEGHAEAAVAVEQGRVLAVQGQVLPSDDENGDLK
jgi:hypothetical protein